MTHNLWVDSALYYKLWVWNNESVPMIYIESFEVGKWSSQPSDCPCSKNSRSRCCCSLSNLSRIRSLCPTATSKSSFEDSSKILRNLFTCFDFLMLKLSKIVSPLDGMNRSRFRPFLIGPYSIPSSEIRDSILKFWFLIVTSSIIQVVVSYFKNLKNLNGK